VRQGTAGHMDTVSPLPRATPNVILLSHERAPRCTDHQTSEPSAAGRWGGVEGPRSRSALDDTPRFPRGDPMYSQRGNQTEAERHEPCSAGMYLWPICSFVRSFQGPLGQTHTHKP
jgi:hypothetical protein